MGRPTKLDLWKKRELLKSTQDDPTDGRKRKRFTREQKQILRMAFKRDPMWRTETTRKLALLLNLPQPKIYKWGYKLRR